MDTQPPASQAASDRPITFMLDDSVSGVGPSQAVTLYVRPEDLTHQQPSRVNVVQTLGGGAWADSFGPGVSTITISGHTGWRRGIGQERDGEERFLQLRSTVFDEWHLRRQRAVAASADPSQVKLIFSDALDSIVATVAPMQFVLRRSRSRPLLFQYQIQMAVLQLGTGGLTGPALPGALSAKKSALAGLGLESLAASLAKIRAFANSVRAFIDQNLLAPVRAFLAVTQEIYSEVSNTIDAVIGIPASLLSVARTAALAGANLFRTFAAVAGLPYLVRGELMQVAAAYTNIVCLLRNALSVPDTYMDYSSIYGSSNCSSTAGGRPLSGYLGSNTFEAVSPAPTPPIVSVSSDSQAALRELSSSDVVLSPMTTSQAAQTAGRISAGIVLQ